MDSAVAGEHPRVGSDYNEITGSNAIEAPLRLDHRLLQLATHPKNAAIAERYFKHRAFLADVDARVVPPARMEDIENKLRQSGKAPNASSSHWYRDARGRQLKLMAYLSDVGASDTQFCYFPNSHRRAPRHPTYQETRLTEDAVSMIGTDPVHWIGKCGSTMMFDTNIAHRLLRRPTGTVRYSITFYYTTGQHLRDLLIDAPDVESLSPESRSMLGGTSDSRLRA